MIFTHLNCKIFGIRLVIEIYFVFLSLGSSSQVRWLHTAKTRKGFRRRGF